MNGVTWRKCIEPTNPKKTGHYLAYYPDTSINQFFVARFDAGKGEWSCGDTDAVGSPSHWCFLPEKP